MWMQVRLQNLQVLQGDSDLRASGEEARGAVRVETYLIRFMLKLFTITLAPSLVCTDLIDKHVPPESL